MRIPLPLILPLIAALAACSDFPQLDEAVDSNARDAKYPDLVPIESIYASIPDTRIDDTTSPDLEARVARLKARAARLRGAVVDGATRQRFKAGVT